MLTSLPSWNVLRNNFCVSPLAPVCAVDSTPSSTLSDCLVVVLKGTSMFWRSVVWVTRTIRTTATPGRGAIRGGVTLSSALTRRPICWSRAPTVGAVEDVLVDVASWRTITVTETDGPVVTVPSGEGGGGAGGVSVVGPAGVQPGTSMMRNALRLG